METQAQTIACDELLMAALLERPEFVPVAVERGLCRSHVRECLWPVFSCVFDGYAPEAIAMAQAERNKRARHRHLLRLADMHVRASRHVVVILIDRVRAGDNSMPQESSPAPSLVPACDCAG